MTSRVLLAGSSGLVGGLTRARLGGDVTALVRAGSSAPGVPVDFERLCAEPGATLASVLPGGVDVGISCLGTTIRAAGSQAAMVRVDHDYVLAVAEGARALGARQFILMTSVGAGGTGFYLQTKGQTERDVIALGFERVDLVRPGLILGPRAERRPFEAFAQHLFAVINPLFVGPLSRYGAIPAENVAAAIAALAGAAGEGVFVHENASLNRLAAGR